MMAGAVAKRYARAAFDVARDQNAVEKWLVDLESLAQAVSDSAVTRWLESSKVPAQRKEEVLIAAQGSIDPLFLNLIRLMIAKDRITLLPEVARMFRRMVNEAQNVETAQVTTAIPIDAAEEARIVRQLSTITGKEIRIETSVDPEIQGGVIARVGDQVIDGSIRMRLERLRREMIAGTAL